MADFERACQANYTNKSEVLRRAMLDYVRENEGGSKMKRLQMNCPMSTRFDAETFFRMFPISENGIVFRHELLLADGNMHGQGYLSLKYLHDSGPYTTTYDKIQAMQEQHAIDFLAEQGIIEEYDHPSGTPAYTRGPNY